VSKLTELEKNERAGPEANEAAGATFGYAMQCSLDTNYPHVRVTLSLPSLLGRNGVTGIIDPPMSDQEREALRRSADTLRSALARMQFSPS